MRLKKLHQNRLSPTGIKAKFSHQMTIKILCFSPRHFKHCFRLGLVDICQNQESEENCCIVDSMGSMGFVSPHPKVNMALRFDCGQCSLADKFYIMMLRFARHPAFMFLLYDVVQSREAQLGYHLLLKSSVYKQTQQRVFLIGKIDENF